MMSDGIMINDTNDLKKYFQSTKREYAPYIYIPITDDPRVSTEESLGKLIQEYKRAGYGGVIPFVPSESRITPFSEQYYMIYGAIADEAGANGLSLGYLDDTYLMKEYLLRCPEASCRILTKYSASCVTGDLTRIRLRTSGDILSVVAINDDDSTVVDLREFVKDDRIEWQVPDGNWNVEQYVCEVDTESGYIDLMDYDISIEYLKQTLKTLTTRLEVSGRKNIELYIYKNINYCGQNRRIWHASFNTVFEDMYGFDPAPYYPLLFRDFGSNAKRYKSMLMECRSKIFNNGFLKAAGDYCKTKNIFCTGYPEESKAVSSSWVFGDGQLYHRYSSAPGVAMPFAYLYGLNGIKVAAGAADVFGTEVVAADVFKHYQHLTKEVIYKEAMNSFVRGINMTFVHLGEDRDKTNEEKNEGESSFIFSTLFSKNSAAADFSYFTARVQTMLRGGEHISEVAIVYPIHSIHAMAYLYQAKVNGFEYSDTAENEDYMELMNNFLNYVGIDASFIHPSAIAERSLAENGTLYMENGSNVMKFKLLVLPSMSVVSLKTLRMIKKFYDEGGKIIATDNLPTIASEYSNVGMNINQALKTKTKEDEEVGELLDYIFGPDCRNNKIYRNVYVNTNERGGAAYFFPSNKTSVDGTDSVSANILYQAVAKFKFAPDVFIDRMPRREFSGIVNYHLPTFLKIGIDGRLSKGCSMNYIHKRFVNTDIFYITNTTGDPYRGNILLRGRHQPEEWNPYNGKIKKMAYEYVRFRGEIYTKVNMSIDASSCTFLVSSASRAQKDIVKELTAQTAPELLNEYFAWENF